MQITPQFKEQVLAALLKVRANFGGTDSAFAKSYNINPSVFSRLKTAGVGDSLIKDAQWISLGRELNITLHARRWNMVRTEVFEAIASDVQFCQQNAKGMILVDDCAIGKTYAAKYLSKTLRNCFYIDASQAKTQQLFIRAIAKALGVDNNQRYADIKADIKYCLTILDHPIVIVDEAGDLNYRAFLELKELWNATENHCGWYLIGADGLRTFITNGIRAKKTGFREIFSRYSDRYMKIIPTDRNERISFYRKLISDVLEHNMDDKSRLPELVKKCLLTDANGEIGGLRRAESLLILSSTKLGYNPEQNGASL
jgi:hypothetical protein